MYNQSYGDVNTCYQTNQNSLTLHSELNQLKMSNIQQETTDPTCPLHTGNLHTGNYSTEENYQSSFPNLFHQSSNTDYQNTNHSYNSISSATTQTHHNEIQLPLAPPTYPSFDYNTSNIEHGTVINTNDYNQQQSISTANSSVMNYTNGSSNGDYKNRIPQIQTYSKFPPVLRSSQDNFVTPKVIHISNNLYPSTSYLITCLLFNLHLFTKTDSTKDSRQTAYTKTKSDVF